jgi:hypothetical protein
MRSTGGGYEITRDNAAELGAAQGAELSLLVGAEGLLRQRAAMRVVPTTPPAAAAAAAAAEVRDTLVVHLVPGLCAEWLASPMNCI